MTAQVFVDTNVFVYRHDTSDPAKQACAEEWITFLARSRTGRLSYQVLHELYVTLARKGRLAFDAPEVRDIVRDLMVWRPVAPDLQVLERAWFLEDRHAVSWWDALIVAAAQACGCTILLTEDMQHGHDFGGVRVVNPFRTRSETPARIMESHGR
ncbi:PIN domain-containing protein [Candidatus Palauibacter sp.]|uniref:PIN domain-containing protein n=1 Tax=Candidatus Palauibacter sp. TaxID=3101350 RepID=UPI003AF2ED6D